MAEEFQGGVCGGMWWNPPLNLFSGGGTGGLSSPCSVAQLGGGYHDMGSFGWSSELTKGRSNNNIHNNLEKNNSVFDNSLAFPADMIDSTLDVLGSGLSPTPSTTEWNQPNLLCKGVTQQGHYDSIIQDGSPPMTLTATSHSSGDSSTITYEGALAMSFPMGSNASYLIQTLFDDSNEPQLEPQPMAQLINPSYGGMSSRELMSPCSWVEATTNSTSSNLPPHSSQNECHTLINNEHVFNGENSTGLTLSNIQASLLNSLQSRSRASTLNQKVRNCSNLDSKVNNNNEVKDKKSNTSDQPPSKRPRIETPSPLPTFKVRKEKLGDRITVLQQLVSPFGKTDTASVLHEAIEYIKFLHDQVNALSSPYLKNGAAIQQQGSNMMNKNNEMSNKQDLRSRGLCLVPIASTYPVAQETPVDFWTPTFGGTATFR